MIATTQRRGAATNPIQAANREAVVAAWGRLATAGSTPRVADVARLAGVSVKTAGNHLKAAGLHKAPPPEPDPPAEGGTFRERVAAARDRLIAAGRKPTVRAVAETAGVNRSTAERHLANARREAGVGESILAAHRKLSAAGRLPSLPEMIRESETSEGAVRRHLAAAGLDWRRIPHVDRRINTKASPADIARAIADATAARRAKGKPPAVEPEPSVTRAAVRDYRRAVKNVRRCAWPIHGGWLSPMRDQNQRAEKKP